MVTMYFTYGPSGHAYKGGWTEVIAETDEIALAAYNAYHPSKNGIIPCAGIYSETSFKETPMYKKGNFGKRRHELIIINHAEG